MLPMMNLGSTEAIKRSVEAGVGVAIVSALTVAQELHDRRLVSFRLADCRLRRSLHVVQARDRSVSKAAGAFLQLVDAATPAARGGARARPDRAARPRAVAGVDLRPDR